MRLNLRRNGTPETGKLGTWVKLGALESVEIMAYAGFDFVVIDMEHAPLSLPDVYTQIVTALANDIAPLVRVPDHGGSTIQRVLDAGAAGILAPHVDTVEQARKVAAATRFPPTGARGSGGTSRAARWGLLPRAEYLRVGNEDVLCIAQLESALAIDNVSEILAVPGIDGAFVGAADLALETGLAAGSLELAALCEKARDAAHALDAPIGWAVGSNPQAARRAYDRGFDFVVAGNDLSMLAETATGLVAETRAPG
ncbi:HpcH/HpaI aldolase/citrate lyase family protein [Kutzneria sp. NPDC052558]|uniref:HpcH/HpaI aldolase/citrate lyase family protein n=1 Tax=Kutzneria sp. NPDC052558 TaxID=3364121 RepID=UPI0037C6F9AD